MTPEHWRRIERLFHAAREQPPDARAAFLAAQCAGDPALVREVQSLLAQQEGSLLRNGVGAAAAAMLPPSLGAHEGRALGPYILGPLLGAGAMGEVYRARDSKLDRDVAVKILPHTVAQHPERLARFEREARVLAALNHPNIGAIYGLEEDDGLRGLVLELVDGETLAEKLSVTPALPEPETIAIAKQIAAALEAAHDKGIVHRDLKPANIKITPSGTVKVLDFGLAKVKAREDDDQSATPALATGEGVLLGTIAYMSPEQARGLVVDRRTDIWAFGCVVFEMVAGRRPFAGASVAEVLGAIMTAEPDWTALPAATPPRIHNLLRRCLVKDPARRTHDIADARLEIEDDFAIVHAPPRARFPGAGPAQRYVPWVIALVALTVAAVAMSSRAIPTPVASAGPTRLSATLPPDVSLFAIGRGPSVAISPDGRRIVFVGVVAGRRQLYSRLLGESVSTPIAGTERAANPFFSPDGQSIGFTMAPEGGDLQRVPIEGGTPLTILRSATGGPRGFAVQGATWAADDTIVFGALNPRSPGLWRVAASGGTPERLTTPPDGFHTWPQVLPGGGSVLYTVWKNTGFEGSRIAVARLSGGEPTILVEGASYGRVVSDSRDRRWLVFARAEGLLAAPFDLERLQLTGPAAPMLSGVLTNLSGAAHFAVSTTGVLAYVPGGLDELHKTPVWVARDGKASEIAPIAGLGFVYRLSPDGVRLARSSIGLGARDLWIDDLDRRTTPVRLTDDAVTNAPVWTPDGRRVIYASGAPAGLFWRAADRSGSEERLTSSANAQTPGSVSPDGRMLAYHEADPERATDLWLLPLQEPRQPRRLLNTAFAEVNPMFSPDGRWLAYSSNLSGAFEVWVASLEGGGQFVVSKGGGFVPLWAHDGRTLFYRSVDPAQGGNMMAAAIDTSGNQPRIGAPRVLFASPYQGNGDVTRDGRFLLLRPTESESRSRAIELVLNWFDDLHARTPRP